MIRLVGVIETKLSASTRIEEDRFGAMNSAWLLQITDNKVEARENGNEFNEWKIIHNLSLTPGLFHK